MAAPPRSSRMAPALSELDLNSAPPLPLIPTRSPLRPSSRSIRTPPDTAAIAEAEMPSIFPSLHTIIDVRDETALGELALKPLPLRPASPLVLSPLEDESASSNSSMVATLSKRQHALLELLDSERAYASDLALIREVHIPLSLGQPVALHPMPSSSTSSSRTVSTASDSSGSSSGPPMTQDDSKVIFSNIVELAIFSDHFCDQLESALGSVVEGGEGEDRVGALFLEIIPEMERPYKYYITRQGGADEHLQALPKTPALEAYYTQTRNVAASISHAWDLHSLLIKPVQRLLKYPLLLAAILQETPDTHPDKDNLRQARLRIEEIARDVNELRRRAEVVKGVLTAKKKTTTNISMTATVNLSKMKSLKRPSINDNDEASKVEKMEAELKRIEVFAQQFARNIVDWSKSMSGMVITLRAWALSFAKVIGLSEERGSDAFDAFLDLVESHLTPLCVDLEAVINERLLKEIAHLLMTMNKPLKLLASMNEQQPLHYHLLNMNVSAKNRPPPALLEASTNYIALRAQLAAELPNYLALMHQGLAFFVRRLADVQARYWQDVRDRWGELWEMLRVEGEMNGGAEETMAVWHKRWADVETVVKGLVINNIPEPVRISSSSAPPDPYAYSHPPLAPYPAPSQAPSPKRAGSSVSNMLMALEPVHSPQVSAPYALSSHHSTTSLKGKRPKRSSSERQYSADSVISGGKSPRSSRPHDGFGDYVAVMSVPGAMTLPSQAHSHANESPRSSGSSHSKGKFEESVVLLDVIDEHERDRGRTAKPSFRRKISDSIRGTSSKRTKSPGALPMSQSQMFLPDSDAPLSPPHSGTPQRERRTSWSETRIKYTCRVVHGCRPPAPVSYFDFPFFTLSVGEVYGVLQEAGHPGHHPKLPLHVDDGEDCLLLCRDDQGQVGWALASFLQPLG